MNVTLQKHFAKFIYVVPDGLRELLNDISREVLRSKPIDVYTFIADYLDAMMVTRENARVASRLVMDIIEISETTANLLMETGLTRGVANRAANIIQKQFRQMLEFNNTKIKKHTEHEDDIVQAVIEQLVIEPEDLVSSIIIIQRAFRAFMQRRKQEEEVLDHMIDWKTAARSAIALYRKTGVTYDDANRAATLIKSAYRAYYQKKFMSKLVREMKTPGTEECLCETYSIDLPKYETELPTTPEECICSEDSDNDIATAIGYLDGCHCQYTSSEMIGIVKGEIPIREIGFTPIAPAEESESDDELCHCEDHPLSSDEMRNFRDDISIFSNNPDNMKKVETVKEEDDLLQLNNEGITKEKGDVNLVEITEEIKSTEGVEGLESDVNEENAEIVQDSNAKTD